MNWVLGGGASLVVLGFTPLPWGLLGLVGFAAVVALRPALCTALIVITLPSYLHPVKVGSLEFSVTEIAILTGTLVVLAQIIWRRWPSFPSPPPGGELAPSFPSPPRGGGLGWGGVPAPSPVDWIVVAFLAAALLSLLVTEYPKQSFRELRWLVVEPLMVFYLARATLRTSGDLTTVLWSLGAAGVWASVASITAISMEGDLLDSGARAAFPYFSANHLGLFLGRAAAVAFAFALFSPLTKASTFGWAAFGAISLAIIRSLSIGAWLGTFVACIALAGLRGKRWLASMLLLSLLLVGSALVVLPRERMLQRFDTESGTGLSRLQIWSASLAMIQDHPLAGLGLDNFLYAYRDHYILPEAWREPNISHPHNWILHFWLQLGILGLGAALACVIWVFATAHHRYHHPACDIDRLIAAACAGIFLDTLIHGLFDNSYFLADAAVVWWVAVALLTIRPSVTDGLGRLPDAAGTQSEAPQSE